MPTTSKHHDDDNCVVCKTRDFLKRYIAFSDENHALAIALWVLHTWVFDGAYATPYMYVTSTEPGCGKSTVLEACHEITRNPMMAGGVTASALFRTIGLSPDGDDEFGGEISPVKPTILIDEVDTIYSGSKNDDLRKVLNTGYTHRGSTLITIGGEPQNLSTFAPKMLAGIDNEELPETVRSRCIVLTLSKMRKDALNVERFLMRKVEPVANALREALIEWGTVDMADKVNGLDVKPLDKVEDRQADIAEPLLQVATVTGHTQEARAALTQIFQGARQQTREAAILETARDLLEQTGGDRLTTAMLSSATGITPDRLGRLMAATGLKPRPIKVAGNTVRGWYLADMVDVFDKYLAS